MYTNLFWRKKHLFLAKIYIFAEKKLTFGKKSIFEKKRSMFRQKILHVSTVLKKSFFKQIFCFKKFYFAENSKDKF